MLVAPYNMFLMDKEEPQLCQGVHFDILTIEEINIDGYMNFWMVSFSSDFFISPQYNFVDFFSLYDKSKVILP